MTAAAIPLIYPRLIQGGMGIGVSNWRLARAVSRLGQLGVVSGTAVDTVLIRRLQDGDPGGHMRRAMQHFPIADVCEQVLRRYFRPSGRPDGVPYTLLSMPRKVMNASRQLVTVLANFVEVWLAREGHDGPVGINLLTKVQMPNLASLYGAMLAGVDYVLMGAGIPREIPAVLDAFAEHQPARLKLDVDGDPVDIVEQLTFDPTAYWQPAQSLPRPSFLAIVSANSLAATLVKKASGRVDGVIVEGPTAGGHNAPPRGVPHFTAAGEPVYGDRDLVDLGKIRELGVPFWLAGGMGDPERIQWARAEGATGAQVGTLFAYCNESGLSADLKAATLAGVEAGTVRIRTDPRASPTGYPFKIVEVGGLAQQDEHRIRVCDLGYLRTAYRRSDGTIAYRCPAEPVDEYVAKGGDVADTVSRRCLCNGLTATIGLAQVRNDGNERPLITSGNDLVLLQTFLAGRAQYSAQDVVNYLLPSSGG